MASKEQGTLQNTPHRWNRMKTYECFSGVASQAIKLVYSCGPYTYHMRERRSDWLDKYAMFGGISENRHFYQKVVMSRCSEWFLFRADSRFAPSQWETALLCNDVSYWLGASLESALLITSFSWMKVHNILFPPNRWPFNDKLRIQWLGITKYIY